MSTDANTSSDTLQRPLFLLTAFIAAAIHVGWAALFYALDQPAIARWDIVAIAVHLTGAALIARGLPFVGIWIVMGSAAIHAMILTIVLGLEMGFAYYFLLLTAIPIVIIREHPRQIVALCGLCLAAGVAGAAGALMWGPWVILGDSVISETNAGLLITTLVAMVASALLIMELNRRTQRELTRLRQEALETRQLGQYTLGDKIGEGGMGEVYRATHALLRRPAAIKLLREGQVTEAAMRRFEREVQLTSELTDPNTIAIFDYGHTPEGVFYYVMEYLGGFDLGTLVERYGPQPPGRVVHILRQVCGALAEAHAHGLVHRDIKPPNIILCERGSQSDMVKMLDFGLVKDLDAQSGTIENVVAGTPAYISPEAIGEPETVGPASDLYAVGAVAYFLLTSEQVFERPTLASILAAHLLDQPAPVHERLGEPVNDVLEALIMQCLEKDPARRPESAQALREALGAIKLDHPWSEEDARNWWADHEPKDVTTAPKATARVHDLSMTVDIGSRRPWAESSSDARAEVAGGTIEAASRLKRSLEVGK